MVSSSGSPKTTMPSIILGLPKVCPSLAFILSRAASRRRPGGQRLGGRRKTRPRRQGAAGVGCSLANAGSAADSGTSRPRLLRSREMVAVGLLDVGKVRASIAVVLVRARLLLGIIHRVIDDMLLTDDPGRPAVRAEQRAKTLAALLKSVSFCTDFFEAGMMVLESI